MGLAGRESLTRVISSRSGRRSVGSPNPAKTTESCFWGACDNSERTAATTCAVEG